MSTKTMPKAGARATGELISQREAESAAIDGAIDLPALRQRYDALHTRKIQAEANKEHSEARLAELKQQAREQFGTDDLEELRFKLREMKAENERRRAEYQQHLAQIEASLEQVVAEHKAAMNEDQDV